MSTLNNMTLAIDFQNIIFSPNYDLLLIKEKIEEIKNFYSPSQIDHQLILAFSLDYNNIPMFKSLLSKSNLEEKDFIHFDQELLFHLLQSNILFPLSVITKNFRNSGNKKLIIEQYLYEELQKQNYLKELAKKFEEEDEKSDDENSDDENSYVENSDDEDSDDEDSDDEDSHIKIRKKTKIEEIIDKDDIESFKIISNSNNFNFNQTITKNNELYHYFQIPILLYCIEKNAIKCFKFALINGADPTLKSNPITIKYGKINYEQTWDAYGFAGATGNIQIIRLLEDKGFEPNECLMEGCSQFHQEAILNWIQKEQSHLLSTSIKNIIFYENFEALNLFTFKDNKIDISLNKKGQKPLHWATIRNSKEIGEILISKGANINTKDIIYLNFRILFLFNLISNKLRKLYKQNETPLHYVALNNSEEMLELLISKGADINSKGIIYLNIIILVLINLI